MKSFEYITTGKWILAGEHSVLRGSDALVFPISECFIKFNYLENNEALSLDFSGPNKQNFELVFWGVFEKALERINRKRSDFKGRLKVYSSLPVGAGLGASAALCVGVGKFLNNFDLIKKEELYEFCRSLEDLFHGESSGVDIAVSLMGEQIKFSKKNGVSPFKLAWQPKWYLSYCGNIGVTSDCINQVKKIKENDPELFENLDAQMADATRQASKALSMDEKEGFSLLVSSINKAKNCFEQWGLTTGSLGYHMKEVEKLGAVAVKPTGSGIGGYVLSLWSKEPPSDFNCIKI